MDDWNELFAMSGYDPGESGVYADNSQGAAPMETWTAVGGGSGEWVSPSVGNWLTGTLDKALNYAVIRDQQKFSTVSVPARSAQTQVALQQANNSKLLLWVVLGAALIYAVKS